MDVFEITKPEAPLPLIFDSPHSGTHYPKDFDYACDFLELRRAEDTYVDELFDFVAQYGGTLLSATFPRSYIDVNRSIDDIDLQLTGGDWNTTKYGSISQTSRSDAGIGLIRRLVHPGLPLYNRLLSPAEIFERIQTYFTPYHNTLETLIEEAYYNFGQVWHINCHSMPNNTARPRKNFNALQNDTQSFDFVIGNRDGTTACAQFSRDLMHFIQSMGYSASLNDPFKGVELIERYSAPTRGKHSIQIEINKRLYMDEETLEKNSNYNTLKLDIEKIVLFIKQHVQAHLVQQAAD